MDKIAVLKRGLWGLRGEIAALTGMNPVRWDRLPRPAIAAVAGWGHAVTANRARRLARDKGVAYLAFEDGPLRSVRPGPEERPLSLVMDRSGIYYDAAMPSDVVAFIADPHWFTTAMAERAESARAQLRHLRLSKYNSGPDRPSSEAGLTGDRRRILVLDQVRGDASIRGALAGADCFKDMLADALAENADAEIIVKIHPDVLSGRREGYFPAIAQSGRVKVIAEPVNPWSLLDLVDTVYTVSSGFGFEALVGGKDVVCYGSPFYAGWGCTCDRRIKVERPRTATPLELFAAYYLRYTHYFDAYSRQESSFEQVAEQLAWLRDRFLEGSSRAVCHRITPWKRGTVNRMLDGPAGRPLHAASPARAADLARRNSGHVVAWASRDNARLEASCAEAGVPFHRVEDGFLRSAGLGASFVLPLSLVFDARGIYYDSARPSDLEGMLEAGDFPPLLLERARRLREALVTRGTTKYNVRETSEIRIDSGGRAIILVPGQVEDDASIKRGSPLLKQNIELLRAVRDRHPEGFIVYKPHPDVEAGFRRGRIIREVAAEYADQIVSNASILALIGMCDRMETMTSLAGFEALLRGKPVTTHGQPFYAGWGLTEDMCPPPRRTRRVSLDELVAAALIRYPRYIDPVSGLVCGPELIIERLAAAAQRELTPAGRLVRIAQVSFARALHIGHSARLRARRNA